jgi:two-component system response regulator AtoC
LAFGPELKKNGPQEQPLLMARNPSRRSVKACVLVVDDDESTRGYLSTLLASRGFATRTAASGTEALALVAAGQAPDAVLLDLVMPGLGGMETLERMRGMAPRLPVVILSAVGQASTVVEAMRRGASDYLTKPFADEELDLVIKKAMEQRRLQDEVRSLRRRLDAHGEAPDIITVNSGLLRLKETARQVADTEATILLLGESGVGKEVFARFVHASSRRRERPFVRINCAALPHDLLESELFGYERGAFSGAHREKPGKLELAEGGSILLDEIGDMSPSLQAKLLHVLQDGEFSRLGATRSLRVDARVLASTNRRLEEAMAAGSFREDLYFRLNVIRLEIPPLRERRDDIPLLARHFLRQYAESHHTAARDLPERLGEALQRYDWPGNVRELENVIQRYVVLGDLDQALAELRPKRPASAPTRAAGSLKQVGTRAAEAAEQDVVRRVLKETRWNRREAARQLRISYKALLNRLKRWNLDAT